MVFDRSNYQIYCEDCKFSRLNKFLVVPAVIFCYFNTTIWLQNVGVIRDNIYYRIYKVYLKFQAFACERMAKLNVCNN